MVKKIMIGMAVAAFIPLAVHAQTDLTPVQRDLNQQKWIEQGLRSGALTPQAPARWEHAKAPSVEALGETWS